MSDFTLVFPHTALQSTVAAVSAVVMVLILAAMAYLRGNVPGFLAAAYCLLLTLGCVVIFHRSASRSPATPVAIQAPVSRQLLTGMNGRPCAALISGQTQPIPVREIVCLAGAGGDCTSTLDVPADRMRSLLAVGQSLGVVAVAGCP
jgi:hypothetical protein